MTAWRAVRLALWKCVSERYLRENGGEMPTIDVVIGTGGVTRGGSRVRVGAGRGFGSVGAIFKGRVLRVTGTHAPAGKSAGNPYPRHGSGPRAGTDIRLDDELSRFPIKLTNFLIPKRSNEVMKVGTTQSEPRQKEPKRAKTKFQFIFAAWERKIAHFGALRHGRFRLFGQKLASPPKIGSDKNGPFRPFRDLTCQGINWGPTELWVNRPGTRRYG
ncbi:hypothetical protein C8R45DRAFT_935869 [Mycena sanguinolenta]|nr:hypothetical protein C8R45DRAFT_935869 [Mycena sanguinolenta]